MLALKQFVKEIGTPKDIITHTSREEISQEVKQFLHVIDTTLRALEEGTKWANREELHISLLKEVVRKDMKEVDSSLAFWYYCVEYRVKVHNVTAKNLFQLHGSNPYELLPGEEGDTSNFCQYGWHDW